MNKPRRVLLLQLLALFVLVVSAIGSVYGALEVVLSAPTSASIDRTIKVDAVLRAGSAGWSTCIVREVRAVLLLPENSSLVSDRNESSIGTLYGGASLTVSWEVVFTQNGTYDLSVIVSWLISGDQRREIIRTTSITIGGEGESFASFGSFLGLGSITACLSLVCFGFFLVRRTNRKGSDSEQTQQEQH